MAFSNEIIFDEDALPQPRSSNLTSRIAPQLTRPHTPGLALKKAMEECRTLKPKLRLVLASERLRIGRRVVDSATLMDMKNLTYNLLKAPIATQKGMKNLTYKFLKAPNGSPAKSLRLASVTVGRLHLRPVRFHRMSQE